MEAAIRISGLLIVLIFGTHAVFRGGDRLAVLFVMLGGLIYFAYNVGFVLSPDKLIGLLAVLWIALRPKKLSLLQNAYFIPFLIYAAYLFYLTLFMSISWPNVNVGNQSFFYSSYMRGFVQISQLIIAIFIILVFIENINRPEKIMRIFNILLLSYFFICIYGIYVWFAQQNGLPFNPISRQGRTNVEIGRVIHERISGVSFVRAYSLTGEPKALALNASLAFILVLFLPLNRIFIFRKNILRTILSVLFLVTLALTLSTSGYVLMPLFLTAAILVQILTKTENVHFAKQCLTLLFVGMAAIYFLEIDIADRVSAVIEARVSSRLSDTESALTYADAAILSFWRDNPLFIVTGVGLGGSSFYVRLYDTSAYAGYTAAPRGLIGFLSDQGIIGLSLYLFAFAKCARPILKAAQQPGPNRQTYSGVLVLIACGLIMQFTITMWYLTWLIIALAIATSRIAVRELGEKRSDKRNLLT